VQGDITVPSGAFLNINAGTVVQFASTDAQNSGLDSFRVELIVRGSLSVLGTFDSPVIFQAQSGTARNIWYGINVFPEATGVNITHAQFHNGLYGVRSRASGGILAVSNTTVDTSSGGINSSDGSPSIDTVAVTNCGTGFFFDGMGSPRLTNVIVSNSSQGIYASADLSALLVTVVNATLYGNTVGIFVGASSFLHGTDVVAQNVLITSGGSGVYRDLSNGPTSATITYSDVWNNANNYVQAAPGTGCISADPRYVGATGNLHIGAESPAIDSGSGSGAPAHDFDGVPRPQDGDGLGGAAWDMGAYERAIAPLVGSVSEGSQGGGVPLTMSTPDHGASLLAQWGAACGVLTNDYAVYEGDIGSWYDHSPRLCTTGGNLSVSFSPSSGGRYYLVVPLSSSEEGVYGHASSGAPIPASMSACRATMDTRACP
jgi:hypothetical protein